MGDRTGISWTDATWNPLAGCTPVSEGCRNCYAAREAIRLAGNPNPKVAAAYGGTAEMRGTGTGRRAVFTGRVNFLHTRLDQPLRWKRPRRIFVNSMSDLFHEEVPDGLIDQVYDVMCRSTQHVFQVLTKRPERMAQFFGAREEWDGHLLRPPLPNVWLGTSVENQDAADERIPHLLRTPAAVRWVSCEPLLGPVDLSDLVVSDERSGEWHVDALLCEEPEEDDSFRGATLDWVVVGGESGPRARPMHAGWARSLRDQCQAAGVPFHFKQWGEWAPRPGSSYARAKRWVGQEWMHRVGKKSAGRLLDGRTWEEWPA